jgi:hypothetical protein
VPVNTPPTVGASYLVDTTQAGGYFAGPITAGRFNSSPPATTKNPVTVPLLLPLFGSATPVSLAVVGAHVQFTYSAGQIVTGQLNGAVKKSDVDNTIIPQIAQSISNKIAADKASGNITSTDMSILSLFDTGGTAGPMQSGCAKACANTCQNPSNVPNACGCATSGDSIVDECEVATNSIVKSIFAPDVQLFDANGNYAPNPQPTPNSKDSLSIGIAFTAIAAKF